MISNLQEIFSNAAKGMKRSAIRELLKLAQNPEIISFAGGLPAPETFPTDVLAEITREVLEENGAMALQYGATEGDTKLRELIAANYRKDGFDITKENVLITTASQQGLTFWERFSLIPEIRCWLDFLPIWEVSLLSMLIKQIWLAFLLMNMECARIKLKKRLLN